jgi:hypothetical protein
MLLRKASIDKRPSKSDLTDTASILARRKEINDKKNEKIKQKK